MDIKKVVRQRIADLTQSAYERGYCDGAQSALTEIESFAADDVVEQLDAVPGPLEAVDGKGSKVTAKQRWPAKKKAAKPKRMRTIPEGSKPKSTLIEQVLHKLSKKNGEARHDEVLAAALAEKPKITKYDLGNGLRTLAKCSGFRVAPDDEGRLLPG